MSIYIYKINIYIIHRLVKKKCIFKIFRLLASSVNTFIYNTLSHLQVFMMQNFFEIKQYSW